MGLFEAFKKALKAASGDAEVDIGNWYGNYAYFRIINDAVYPYELYNDWMDDFTTLTDNVMFLSRTTTSTTETEVFRCICYGKLDGNLITNARLFEVVGFLFACPNVAGEVAVITKVEFDIYNYTTGDLILSDSMDINYQATIEDVPEIVPFYYYHLFKKPKDIGKYRAFKTDFRIYGYSQGGGQVEIGLFNLAWAMLMIRVRGGRV